LNDSEHGDPRIAAIPDVHGHAKGEHKPYAEERPIPLSARMLFLWFFHACKRGSPRFLMVSDHMNYLTFEDPAAVNLVRRALKLAQAGDLYGAAETAGVDVGHAAVVSDGLRRGMRYSIGAEVDNDPRARPDAQNIVDAMKPDGIIRSVHFLTIDHPTHGAGWSWPFDNPEFISLFDHVGVEKTWELYMATLIDAIERLPGNIVGHFYVPAIFGHWPDDATLEKYEDQLLDACAAREMAIEFNTRFLYRDRTAEEKAKYIAANRRLLRKAKERGVGIAVGADAHSPKDQGHAFDQVLAILDELEINELVFPIGGRLLRVALRVIKEPEPPAPEPPPVPEPVKAVRKARTSESPKERPSDESPAKPNKETKRRTAGTKLEVLETPEPEAPAPKAKAKKTPPNEPPTVTLGAVANALESVADAAIDAPAVVLPSVKAKAPAKAKTVAPAAKPTAMSPVKVVSAKAAPAKTAPVKTAPAKTAPAKTAPVKTAPVKTAPVKTAPAKAPPTKASPLKVVPTKAKAPVKAAPKATTKAKTPAKPAAKSAPKKTAAKAASQAKPTAKAKTVSKAKAAPTKAKPKATPKRAVPAKKAAKPAARKPAPKKPAKKAPARPARPTAKKPAVKKSAAKKTTKRSR
jgi:HisJ family histidinol phosphate phosphatase